MDTNRQATAFFPDSDMVIEHKTDGAIRLHILHHGLSVSHLRINPHRLRIGKAILPIAYLTDVETEEGERGKGYGRRLQEAAIALMRTEYALALLHGITNFYPRFGYNTCGPDHIINLTELHQSVPFPENWKVRPMQWEDLPAIQHLYHACTQGNVGAVVREENDPVWMTLIKGTYDGMDNACRVLEHPDGHLAAYAWRGQPFWCVRLFEQYNPDALVLAEVMAEDHIAADALLSQCRIWAKEEEARRGKPISHVTLSFPPEGPLASAAMMQDAKFLLNCFSDGGLMGQVLDTPRTLLALQPELEVRFRAAGTPFSGTLWIQTDQGNVLIALSSEGLSVTPCQIVPQSEEKNTLRLTQATLVRLVLGAFFPDDLLTRCCSALSPQVKSLFSTLFPLRQPHIYLPDRGVE